MLLLVGVVIGIRLWSRIGGGPAESSPPLPNRAVPTRDAQEVTLADGRKLYDWISVPVGEEAIRFRLVTGGSGPRPVEPFYVMESKVSNQLYHAGGEPHEDSLKNHPDAPVTHVTAEEAARFAASVFGGRLPTPAEWDHAAGLYSGLNRPEVTRPGGRPRVGLARPEPTRGPDAGHDVNELGLRDMAGNGREWTRATATGVKEVGVHLLVADDHVVVRGRRLTHPHGLTFANLAEEQATPQTQLAHTRSPHTSFRVVLAVPPR
jgi:hypothetical protein